MSAHGFHKVCSYLRDLELIISQVPKEDILAYIKELHALLEKAEGKLVLPIVYGKQSLGDSAHFKLVVSYHNRLGSYYFQIRLQLKSPGALLFNLDERQIDLWLFIRSMLSTIYITLVDEEERSYPITKTSDIQVVLPIATISCPRGPYHIHFWYK